MSDVFYSSDEKTSPGLGLPLGVLEVLGEIPEQLGQVDLVDSRAFKSIAGVLEVSRAYYAKGGRYYLMKARLDKINEELTEAKRSFKNLKADIIPLKSPVLEVERHVVVINS